MKRGSVILPILALTIICVLVTGALSITNYFTKDIIDQQEQQAITQTMNQLIPDAEYRCFYGVMDQNILGYTAMKDGHLAGYIFSTDAMGYKSRIAVMTAFDVTGQILQVAVTNCADESPGIGQKVATDTGFLSQFAGVTAPTDQIDAITGATYSSQAVHKAVSIACDAMQHVLQNESPTEVTAVSVNSPTGGVSQ